MYSEAESEDPSLNELEIVKEQNKTYHVITENSSQVYCCKVFVYFVSC